MARSAAWVGPGFESGRGLGLELESLGRLLLPHSRGELRGARVLWAHLEQRAEHGQRPPLLARAVVRLR